VLSSGATAIRPAPGMLAVAGTNGGVDAIAPGTIDSGAYDALGEEGKAALFYRRSENNPAGRIGSSEDVAQAVLFALTADFLTGVSIPVDGGEILV
ncbi:MAG: SDR family oxidoreductase, partial [Candidatus Dormibacteraceae bacterium]